VLIFKCFDKRYLLQNWENWAFWCTWEIRPARTHAPENSRKTKTRKAENENSCPLGGGDEFVFFFGLPNLFLTNFLLFYFRRLEVYLHSPPLFAHVIRFYFSINKNVFVKPTHSGGWNYSAYNSYIFVYFKKSLSKLLKKEAVNAKCLWESE